MKDHLGEMPLKKKKNGTCIKKPKVNKEPQ